MTEFAGALPIFIAVSKRDGDGTSTRLNAAAYAIRVAVGGRTFEHWGIGREADITVMAAHAMIRLHNELAAYDNPRSVVVITTAASTLENRRQNLARYVERKDEHSQLVKVKKAAETKRHDVWLEFARLSEQRSIPLGESASMEFATIIADCKKAANMYADLAVSRKYNEDGLYETDDDSFDWLDQESKLRV